MSDIQAIRAERDRAQLACQQIAERLTAAEARAEAAEARVGELGKLCKEAADLYGQGGTFPIDGVMSERLRTAARAHAEALLNPDPWRPISELEEKHKDGRTLDLWVRDYADGAFRIPDCKWGIPWPGADACWLENKPHPDALHDWEWQPIDFAPTHFREIKGPGQ